MSDRPQGGATDEEQIARQRRSSSHADAAGATLIVVAIAGGIAWVWRLVRTQFFVDEPGSLGTRLDLVVDQTLVVLLSGVVAGLGIGLRALAATQSGSPARPALSRPVGRILLVVAATLVMFLGGATIVEDHDDGRSDLGALFDNQPSVDVVIPAPAPVVIASERPLEPTHTLEVHSDGCGVIRSGEIGDDLAWVIKDRDGFQVLGRNAAGETQYRYFRPGTYTVALEAWGGSYYVAVSNEITITC